jgi:hypothetical protein
MAVTLGGTSIAPPAAEDGYRVEEVPRGRILELASGKITFEAKEYITRRHVLVWKYISASDFATLAGKIAVTTAQTFVPPYGGSSVSVIVVPGTWKYTPRKLGDGNSYYSCEVVLQEVGA